MTKFRIHSQKVFLTYPQTETTPEQVLEQLDKIYPVSKYVIAQEEHKDEGKHIHAYLEFEKKHNIVNEKYFDVLCDKHGNYQSVKDKNGTIRYCLGFTEDKGNKLNPTALVKDIDVEWYKPKNAKAKKVKEEGYHKSMLQDIKQGMTQVDLIEKYPQISFKGRSNIEFLYEKFAPKVNFNLYEEYQQIRPFQEYLLDVAQQKPDKRKIIWIYDKVGNSGKSELADHLTDQLGFIKLNNGKSADITYAWNGENIVFDFSRTVEGHINWEVIEQLKNGRVLSTKYNSALKRFQRPHLFIFSNFLPVIKDSDGKDTVSLDRWEIYEINKDYTMTDITQQTLERSNEQKEFNTTFYTRYGTKILTRDGYYEEQQCEEGEDYDSNYDFTEEV